MADLYLIRTLRGFEPADDAGREALRKIRLGKTVHAEIKQPRNIQHHRKFFALLNLVWAAAGEWESVEDLLIELKVRLGITKDVIIRSTGEVVKIPGSISFASMDQTKFDEFFERSIAMLSEMAGGIGTDILRQEVLSQLAAA